MNNITAFNGLRFIVIVLLIFHHFDIFNDLKIEGWETYMRYFAEGFLSVNFFFILSGFCISYGYYEKLKSNKINSLEFFKKRIIHIWPIHFIFLLIALFLYYYNNISLGLFSLKFFVNLFLLQSFIPSLDYFFSYNGLSWAVSNEIFYYLLFIMIVCISERKQYIICALLWTIILLNIIIAHQNGSADVYFFYINPIFRFGDFLIGIVLYHLYKRGIMLSYIKLHASFLEFCSILILLISIYLGSICNDLLWKWQVWYTITCAPLIYVFSVSKGNFSKILSNKLFSYLGSIAYPLYLSHQVVLAAVKKLFIEYLITCESILLFGIISIFISIILSIIIKHCVMDKIMKIYLQKYA